MFVIILIKRDLYRLKRIEHRKAKRLVKLRHRADKRQNNKNYLRLRLIILFDIKLIYPICSNALDLCAGLFFGGYSVFLGLKIEHVGVCAVLFHKLGVGAAFYDFAVGEHIDFIRAHSG